MSTAAPTGGAAPAGATPEPEGLLTVLIALGANALISVAKSVAAFLTGSASMVAEAAHSWADTGNEVLLLVAERRSGKPRDASHPMGYGREAYVWSMVAAFGLFIAGSILSITHGISALRHPGAEESDYLVAYVVLAISFVLEGVSFAQATRQARTAARRAGLRPLRFVLRTSETTLRAVFFEDAAALVGIAFAAGGIYLHQVTGNAAYDAVGSILVGVLLGGVAVILIVRNGQFLIGEAVEPELRQQALRAMLESPEIDRITYLHMEYVGPSKVYLVASVDLAEDHTEHVVAEHLQAIEDRLEQHAFVERARLSLAAPGEESLLPDELT
ncbi:cation transporter [Mariniluteicoccus endophyticus]